MVSNKLSVHLHLSMQLHSWLGTIEQHRSTPTVKESATLEEWTTDTIWILKSQVINRGPSLWIGPDLGRVDRRSETLPLRRGEERLILVLMNCAIYRDDKLRRSNEAERWLRVPSCMHKSRRETENIISLDYRYLVMEDEDKLCGYSLSRYFPGARKNIFSNRSSSTNCKEASQLPGNSIIQFACDGSQRYTMLCNSE
jgi:hypothetical protein